MSSVKFHNKNGTLSLEWSFNKGGYFGVNQDRIVFLHRFRKKGQAFLENEKEFIFRVELMVDHEEKLNWLNLGLFNIYESRLVYLWVKLWKRHNLFFTLDFGWRFTIASKKVMQENYIKKQAQELKNLKDMGAKIPGVKVNNNGGNSKWLNRTGGLRAI